MPSKSPSQVLQWKVETVKLADLKPSPYNPRKITDKHLAGLKMSLKRFGYVEPIVWNRTTGNVVGGHQRLNVLLAEKVEEAQVLVVELSEEDELAANLSLNNPAIEGEWDEPALELLAHIESVEPKFFAGAGFGDLRKAIEGKKPKSEPEVSNQEVDVDDLVSDCDTECPCCKFRWKVDEKDVHLLSAEEQEELANG